MNKISMICLIVWIIGLIMSYFTIRYGWNYKRKESSIIKYLTGDDCAMMIFVLLLPVINIIVCFLELFTYIPNHIDDVTMDKLFLKKNKKDKVSLKKEGGNNEDE